MRPGQTEYLGDGAYLHFDGYGFELRANHHEYPSDRVYLEGSVAMLLLRLIQETVDEGQKQMTDIAQKTAAKLYDEPQEAHTAIKNMPDFASWEWQQRYWQTMPPVTESPSELQDAKTEVLDENND